jgi:hypothetical protein
MKEVLAEMSREKIAGGLRAFGITLSDRADRRESFKLPKRL